MYALRLTILPKQFFAALLIFSVPNRGLGEGGRGGGGGVWASPKFSFGEATAPCPPLPMLRRLCSPTSKAFSVC